MTESRTPFAKQQHNVIVKTNRGVFAYLIDGDTEAVFQQVNQKHRYDQITELDIHSSSIVH